MKYTIILITFLLLGCSAKHTIDMGELELVPTNDYRDEAIKRQQDEIDTYFNSDGKLGNDFCIQFPNRCSYANIRILDTRDDNSHVRGFRSYGYIVLTNSSKKEGR